MPANRGAPPSILRLCGRRRTGVQNSATSMGYQLGEPKDVLECLGILFGVPRTTRGCTLGGLDHSCRSAVKCLLFGRETKCCPVCSCRVQWAAGSTESLLWLVSGPMPTSPYPYLLSSLLAVLTPLARRLPTDSPIVNHVRNFSTRNKK
jgi:hypothetical protein